jgi:hypothetical protein
MKQVEGIHPKLGGGPRLGAASLRLFLPIGLGTLGRSGAVNPHGYALNAQSSEQKSKRPADASHSNVRGYLPTTE